MQLADYLASGGPERLLIIVGAILMGYWGYRIHAQTRAAGLALLGLSGAVLIAALLTVHQASPVLQARDEQPRPASPAGTPATDLPQPASPAAGALASDAGTALPAPEHPTPAAGAEAPATEPEVVAQEYPLPLASGDELGGKIVSVHGGNVSLEWSSEDARRREPVSPSTSP